MQTPDFLRSRIDAMINLNDPLAVLARRMPWAQIEAALAPMFEHRDRPGEVIEGQDLAGRRTVVQQRGTAQAGGALDGQPGVPQAQLQSL